VLRPHLDARVLLSALRPRRLEVFEVELEPLQRVVLFEEELLELLDDDEDE